MNNYKVSGILFAIVLLLLFNSLLFSQLLLSKSLPDTFLTKPTFTFNPGNLITAEWTPSEIKSGNIDSLIFTHEMVEYDFYDPVRISIPWSIASVDSDTTFGAEIVYSYLALSDTVDTMLYTVTLKDVNGNEISMAEQSLPMWMYLENDLLPVDVIFTQVVGAPDTLRAYFEPSAFVSPNESWVTAQGEAIDNRIRIFMSPSIHYLHGGVSNYGWDTPSLAQLKNDSVKTDISNFSLSNGDTIRYRTYVQFYGLFSGHPIEHTISIVYSDSFFVYPQDLPGQPDTLAPNTTGTIAVVVDSPLIQLTIDEQSIGTDSLGDIRGYKYYWRASDDEAWTYLREIATPTDTTFTLLYSPGSGDTIFAKVAAIDTSHNEDAGVTGYVAFGDYHVFAFATSDTLAAAIQELVLERNTQAASKIGADTINFKIANCPIDWDTVEVPIIVPDNYAVGAYYRVKWLGDSSNWKYYPPVGHDWTFAWDGLALDDSLAAYKNGSIDDTLQALELAGAAVIVDTLGSRWVRIKLNNQGIRYQDLGLDTSVINDSLGTVAMTILVRSYAPTAFVSFWEATNSTAPFNNRIYLSITTTGTLRGVHEGNNNSESMTSTGTVPLDTPTRVLYTWDQANGNHSIKIGAASWGGENDPGMSLFERGVYDLNASAIGEMAAGSTEDALIYVRDVKVYPDYRNPDTE